MTAGHTPPDGLDIMTLESVSETLAGRIAVNTLYPFCWPERHEKPAPTILKDLFEIDAEELKDLAATISNHLTASAFSSQLYAKKKRLIGGKKRLRPYK